MCTLGVVLLWGEVLNLQMGGGVGVMVVVSCGWFENCNSLSTCLIRRYLILEDTRIFPFCPKQPPIQGLALPRV